MRKDRALTPEERMDARSALAILRGSGISLEDAAIQATGRTGAVNRITVDQAIGLFIKSRISKGLRSTTVDFYSMKLDVFADTFGGTILDDLVRSDVEAWLMALAVKNSTLKGYYRSIHALIGWAAAQNPPITTKNIVRGIDVLGAKLDRSIDILTTDEAELIAASSGPYSAMLALMMFAGIRPSEIRSKEKPPMQWKQVDFDERIVRITSAQSKTRNARILEGLPANLWAFLETSHKKKSSEFIAPARYRQARKIAKEAIGRWSHDVCRHSFITYHLAQFKNISETMLIAGHEGSPSTMYQKYRGLATKAEAEKYFNIQPKAKS